MGATAETVEQVQEVTGQKYKYGFVTEIDEERPPKGLNEDIVRFISAKKGEPDALILRVDLSWVQSPAQAKDAFEFWVQRIESNKDLWLDDWERRSPGRRAVMFRALSNVRPDQLTDTGLVDFAALWPADAIAHQDREHS